MMLHTRKFALAGGILWGAMMFLCTLLAIYTGYSTAFLELMRSIYPGYTICPMGLITGTLYGFFDAFVGLYIFAWLYNKLPN